MQTPDHGSLLLAVAASSLGYLLSCGWSELALGYAKALHKDRDITNILNPYVVMDFFRIQTWWQKC